MKIGKIKSVNINTHNETFGIFYSAIEQISLSTVEKNSAEVVIASEAQHLQNRYVDFKKFRQSRLNEVIQETNTSAKSQAFNDSDVIVIDVGFSS